MILSLTCKNLRRYSRERASRSLSLGENYSILFIRVLSRLSRSLSLSLFLYLSLHTHDLHSSAPLQSRHLHRRPSVEVPGPGPRQEQDRGAERRLAGYHHRREPRGGRGLPTGGTTNFEIDI